MNNNRTKKNAKNTRNIGEELGEVTMIHDDLYFTFKIISFSLKNYLLRTDFESIINFFFLFNKNDSKFRNIMSFEKTTKNYNYL